MNSSSYSKQLGSTSIYFIQLKTGQVVSWLYFARFWLDYSRQRSQIQQYQVLQ